MARQVRHQSARFMSMIGNSTPGDHLWKAARRQAPFPSRRYAAFLPANRQTSDVLGGQAAGRGTVADQRHQLPHPRMPRSAVTSRHPTVTGRPPTQSAPVGDSDRVCLRSSATSPRCRPPEAYGQLRMIWRSSSRRVRMKSLFRRRRILTELSHCVAKLPPANFGISHARSSRASCVSIVEGSAGMR